MGIKLEQIKEALTDRFDIDRQLGKGGMATVYHALDRASGRAVAVKVLRPELAVSIEGGRFHREIRILSKLDHPNILPLLEDGEVGIYLFYTMPYCEAGSLEALMATQDRFSVERAMGITEQLVAALDYAHAHNVVHRDIKPANVLFEGDRALLCDFGVARAMVTAGGDDISSSGLVVGTPDYMSPEQASGNSVLDGRSDIYSLACMVFEMLAGQPPFTGFSAQAVMARHVSEEPPSIRVHRPELPDHIDEALRKALDKKPRRRPQRAAQFMRLLKGE